MKVLISLSSASSMATPTICNPCGPYFFCISTNDGISILQDSHHVAQKLTSTALPSREESRTSLPSGTLFSAKSGATEPFCGSGNSSGGASASFFAASGFAACCTPEGCAALRSTTLLGCGCPFTAITTPVNATTRERIRTTLLSTKKSSNYLFAATANPLEQRLLDGLFKFRFAIQANNLMHNFAGPIHKERRRQAAHAAVQVHHLLITHHNRVVHAHFLCELGDRFFVGIVLGNAHNLQALIAVFFL